MLPTLTAAQVSTLLVIAANDGQLSQAPRTKGLHVNSIAPLRRLGLLVNYYKYTLTDEGRALAASLVRS